MAWLPMFGTFTVSQRGEFYVVHIEPRGGPAYTEGRRTFWDASRVADTLRKRGYVQVSAPDSLQPIKHERSVSEQLDILATYTALGI